MGKRGVLICFEGLDHCGKSSQARILAEYITKHYNQETCVIAFPTRDTPTGYIIDRYLKNISAPLEDHTAHLLFSTNRWEKRDYIIHLLENGTNVILDRYSYSGIAYSLAKNDDPTLSYEWCLSSEKGLPKPDIVFYFTIDARTAARRCMSSFKQQERFETLDFLSKVKSIYEQLLFNKRYWKAIDAEQPEERITQDIILQLPFIMQTAPYLPIQLIY